MLLLRHGVPMLSIILSVALASPLAAETSLNLTNIPLPPARPAIETKADIADTAKSATATAGDSLPLCPGTDNRKWNNCVGTFQIENLGEYSGEIRDHKPNGSGVFKSIDGSLYQGDFKNGVPAGKGRFTSARGAVYVGEFADGVANGEGSEIAPDGARYAGTYANGVRDGKGRIVFPDGREYEGEFKADRIEGYGNFVFPNGDSYSGVFYDNEPTDRGIYRFSNGDRYVGAFKNFKPAGQGVLTFASGVKLIGAFADGVPKGPAVLYDADGELIFEGDVVGFDAIEKARDAHELKRKAARSALENLAGSKSSGAEQSKISSAASPTLPPKPVVPAPEQTPPQAQDGTLVVRNVSVAPLQQDAADMTRSSAQPKSVDASENAQANTVVTVPTPSAERAGSDATSQLQPALEHNKNEPIRPNPTRPEPSTPKPEKPSVTATPAAPTGATSSGRKPPLNCKRDGDLLVAFITCQVSVPQAEVDDIRFADAACRSGRDYLAEYDQSRAAPWYDGVRLFKAYFYFRPFDYRGLHRYRDVVHFLVSGCKARAFTIRINGEDWTWPEQGAPIPAAANSDASGQLLK